MGSTDKAQEILESLEVGVAELVTSEDWIRSLEVASKFHTYSFSNTMLIFMQRPDATRVAGFKAWQKLGRQVRKGEKGIAILAPLKVRVKDEENADSKTFKLVGFRVVHVFDIAQTDGDPLPEVRPSMLEGEIESGLVEQAIAQIESAGCTFEITESPIGNGYFSPKESKVVVAPGMSPAQTFKTTVHELAHVKLGHGSNEDPYSIGEIEAESVAYVVCKSLGIEADSYSFAYVAAWSDGDTDKIRKVGERVLKTARAILEGIQTDEGEEEIAQAQ